MNKFFAVIMTGFLCTGAFAGQEIKIVNWNAQTFFDAEACGTEYKEFAKGNSPWNKELYEQRLDRLCDVIEKLDGDIVVLEEIENGNIVYDISNRLQKNSFRRNKLYRYACFAKSRGSSIGCAVLSRLELEKMKVHAMFTLHEAFLSNGLQSDIS